MANLILDTNLLILFMLGSYSPNDIPSNNYTSSYDKSDFDLLKRILEIQSSICITPQILAELSNQSFKIFYGNKKNKFLEILVNKLTKINEKYIELSELLKETELFYKFGFTDLSIFELAKKGNFVVLTDDHKLHNILEFNKLHSLNFTKLRGQTYFEDDFQQSYI
jgi:rRNA-processing protein FCF1